MLLALVLRREPGLGRRQGQALVAWVGVTQVTPTLRPENQIVKLSIAAMPAILLLGSTAAQAQTAATANTSTSSGAIAATMLAPGAIAGTTVMQGAGATAAGAAAAASAGGWNQPQLVMNTGSAPSTSTFNDCGVAFSGLWLLTMSHTTESEDCKAQ